MSKLKDRRKEYGMTQQEAADLLGISSRGYQNYEQGKRTPPPHIALKMAKLFNIHPRELCDDLSFLTEEAQEHLTVNPTLTISTLIHDEKIDDYIKTVPIEKFANDHDEVEYIDHINTLIQIQESLDHLNKRGQEEAAHSLQLLVKIPEFRALDEDIRVNGSYFPYIHADD